jgi:ribosomal protein L31
MKANEIHSYYYDKIGSQQIASKKALRKIEKFGRRFERNHPNGYVL